MRSFLRKYYVQPTLFVCSILAGICMLPALIAQCITDIGYNDIHDTAVDRKRFGRGIGRDS